jgi:carbonic anhydrase/acetyltransferase-like protein (isoleucine patch superfamily)
MPQKGHGVFIAPNANVLGDVKLGSNTSIWYGACLRGQCSGKVETEKLPCRKHSFISTDD